MYRATEILESGVDLAYYRKDDTNRYLSIDVYCNTETIITYVPFDDGNIITLTLNEGYHPLTFKVINSADNDILLLFKYTPAEIIENGSSEWILGSGVWDDTKFWDDNDVWID